ncbi:MAG: TIGR04283 family arsenosugar biosynthesis glycosyltransferase [Nonlabens sp.]
MLSIIIPILNEEEAIAGLLQLLVERSVQPQELEFILVDGGSDDCTLNRVEDYQCKQPNLNIKLIETKRGRARQLAAGARIATQPIYYFLHADSHPPVGFDGLIIDAVQKKHDAGCFRMRFRSLHPWLLGASFFTRFNWRASRGGDQSQYITASLYHEIGGYNESLPIYEDYDLIHKLYDLGQFYVIPAWLTTSARRYRDKGVMKLQLIYFKVYWKKKWGASIAEIHQYYLDNC